MASARDSRSKFIQAIARSAREKFAPLAAMRQSLHSLNSKHPYELLRHYCHDPHNNLAQLGAKQC